MSSHAPTEETGISDASALTEGTDTTTTTATTTPSQFDVERRLLCDRIAALERELARERRRREQVVDHYERLLERERRDENEPSGWLRGLF